MYMSFSTMLSTMSAGMLRTCGIFFLTLIGSLPLGMLVCMLRKSKNVFVRTVVKIYISVMRGTPLMLQVMFIYFLLPNVLPFKFDRFWAAILAFTINYAAYFAEICLAREKTSL